MSIKSKFLVRLILLTIVAMLEATIIIRGYVLIGATRIEISTELYPYDFTYECVVVVNKGRGMYIINIIPNTTISLTILYPYRGQISILELDDITKYKVISIYSEGPIVIHIAAFAKAYQTDMGIIEVRRH